MTSLMFMLLMQYVVSTKAGLVNYVQGTVNVKAMQGVDVGKPITTGTGGFAEVLLNPGSYLRLGENSEAVLDGVALDNISVRIVSGTGIIEAVGFAKDAPLKVATGNLSVEIIKDGIYTFSDGKATVVSGKIQTPDTRLVISKGYEVSKPGIYRALKLSKTAISSPVEIWSQRRSEIIASASLNIANSLRRSRNSTINSTVLDAWWWIPTFGYYVYMPGYGFRSPYGYRYQSPEYSRGDGGGGGSVASSGNGGFNSSGGSNAGGGGGSGGGSSSAAPVPIESRPIQSQIGVDRPSPAIGKPGL